MAEGGGFEPPEMRSTSTAFEAAPFVRSGNLPSTSLASWPPHADELDDPALNQPASNQPVLNQPVSNPDPTDVLDLALLRAALIAVADPSRAEGMKAYMNDIAPFLGVSTPDRRRTQRALTNWVRTTATNTAVDVLLDFADACWAEPEREFQYAATDLLRVAATKRGGTMLGPEHLPRIEQLLRTKPWWDTIDSLAAWTVGPMVQAHPVLVSTMDEWIEDDDRWIARTAILHQLSYGRATDSERLFRYADRRAADSEFFIRKALGWALRQYARVSPDEVRSFVQARDDQLSGLTRREALKHLDP